MSRSSSVSLGHHPSDTGAPERKYERPALERIGTFRELTQHDFDIFGALLHHPPHGCMMTGSSTYTCHPER
jgi:hypothetical protein